MGTVFVGKLSGGNEFWANLSSDYWHIVDKGVLTSIRYFLAILVPVDSVVVRGLVSDNIFVRF